ncbi:glycerol dehydratase reactivase beta/small subunit family protein [Kineosporia rhizophila]|uniref:glycerol dehydratase reactivase beta/small subunit family protein n=1 Tax=Kineosporia rhizophila TaxID=84633 RepID=UPI001E53DEAB|nr:glycerol dehydratase reactivase beta/small subunit family protein [Kineosporia rhizophila]MCE0534786.1 glycerol dehydratase reactivase beta/small subunit family protein [Kineosporia rhizophila]
MKPRVVVLTSGPLDLLREICAGLEEEGVPFEVVPQRTGAARDLAHRAANRSPLQVGVGLDATGLTIVHHSKLPTGKPVSRDEAATPQAARRAGRNAARVVVSAPLNLEEPA